MAGSDPVREMVGLPGPADAVVLVTPLTGQTRGLLDARRLALLPSGALVVNVGRGPVLSTEALRARVSELSAELVQAREAACRHIARPIHLAARHCCR